MFCEETLINLISKWTQRLDKTNNPEYNSTLKEFIQDMQYILNNEAYLQSKINNLPPKEIEDYFLQQEAEHLLSLKQSEPPVA